MNSDAPDALLVLYDEQCALCRRCHQWLEGQATHVPLHFLPAGGDVARREFGDVPWLGADLVVVDDHNNVWAGPAAFLMCLWATVDYRAWSYRLSGKALAPLAERFFHFVSSNRKAIGRVVGSNDCPDGRCRHREPASAFAAPLAATPPGPDWYAPPDTRCPHCGAAGYESGRACWSCAAVL
jgi:predicted DCC family thiol-disulfide oxidoreductase YuxK